VASKVFVRLSETTPRESHRTYIDVSGFYNITKKKVHDYTLVYTTEELIEEACKRTVQKP